MFCSNFRRRRVTVSLNLYRLLPFLLLTLPGLARDVLVWEKAFDAVQDTEGRPWLGAEVHLLSGVIAGAVRGERDHVIVKPDAQGRFRAEILGGRSYLVWATEAVGKHRYRASRMSKNVQVGASVVLRQESDTFVQRVRLRICPSGATTRRADTSSARTTPRVRWSRARYCGHPP